MRLDLSVRVLDSVQLVPTAAYGEKRQATTLACSRISGLSLRSHVVSRLRYVEKTNLTSSPSSCVSTSVLNPLMVLVLAAGENAATGCR